MNLMFRRAVFALLLLAAFPTSLSAQAPEDEWQTRTFHVSAKHFLDDGTGALDGFKDSLTVLDRLPQEDATDAVWGDYIRESSALMIRWMASYPGFLLPENSLLVFDRHRATLCVRTSREPMKMLARIVEDLARRESSIVLYVDTFEAKASLIRQMVDDTRTQMDHRSTWQELMNLAGSGQARRLRSTLLETRSGQRATVSAGKLQSMPAGSLVSGEEDTRHAGVELDVDPVLSPDSRFVDVKLDFESHYDAPVGRSMTLSSMAGAAALEVPAPEFRCAHVSTSVTISDGGVRLLAVWNPEKREADENGDLMQAAFLRAKVVPLLPAPNRALKARFLMLTEKIAPVAGARQPQPPKEPASGLEDDGLYTWSFLVPPDFFSVASVAASTPSPQAPADPFGSGPAGGPRCISPKELLEANGIPFPEGSMASFVAATSHLIVRNFPRNLKLIESYVAGLKERGRPRLLVFTLNVVQGEGTLMRQLVGRTEGLSDHAVSWKEAMAFVQAGQMQMIRTLRLDGRSGQRILSEAGLEHAHIVHAHSVPAEPGKTGEENSGKASPAALLKPEPPTLELERRICGLQFETDPLLSPDFSTVDINFALEHHYAPPSTRQAPPAADLKAYRVDLPATDFHCAKILSAITMLDGMTKVIGIWKPEGSPEFDGKDVMQAAFLQVDVVALGKE